MALEASIVERLQELRRWQVKQQERLFQQQQEQRESLSREQVRMYEALGLSIPNVSAHENKSDSVYKDSLEESMIDAPATTKNESFLTSSIGDADCTQHLSPQKRHEMLHDSSHSSTRVKQGVIESANISWNNVSSPTSRPVESKKPISATAEASQSSGKVKNGLSDQLNYDSVKDALVSHKSIRIHNDQNNGGAAHFNSQSRKSSSLIPEPLINCAEPLPLDKLTRKSLIIDDIPVPSPNKDFNTLLEERLRESQSVPANDNSASETNSRKPVRRTFLKKGQGLARFRLNSANENSTKHMRPRTMSLPSTVRMENAKNVKSNSDGSIKITKKVKKCTAKIEKAEKKPISVPNRAQSRLSLKNVQPPARVRSKSMCIPREPTALPDTLLKKDDKFNISDIESKTKRELEEVRIFELLEEKAENSSFCSTSSTVVALLQQSVQSTPLKMKSMNKNHVSNVAQNRTNRNDNINEDLLLAEIVCTTESNNAACNPSVSYKKLQNHPKSPQGNKEPERDKIGPNQFQDNQYFYDSDDQENSTDNICELPYGTDVDPEYNTDYQRVDEVNCINEKELNPQGNYAKSTSLHVRFSEYNEYKTFGLTDTSTLSTESGPPRNYSDRKAWSDCSVTTDSSDAEDSTCMIQFVNNGSFEHKETFTNKLKVTKSKEMNGGIYMNRHYDDKFLQINASEFCDEYCAKDQSGIGINIEEKYYKHLDYKQVEGDNDLRTTLGEMEKNENSDTENEGSTLVDSTLIEEELDSVETKENGSIFKSELLKIRLLELEQEIEIFRKETIAVTTLKEKLQEERKALERNFKEKESQFEERKQRLESTMQEEKKRLTREKAALENRLKDTQVKAQQSKLERQELQSLRDQLEELRAEVSQKESRWNAAQARHRSQFRILQSENSKLKQEIQKLQNTGKATTKRKLQVKQIPSSNTKAIHQINKQLESQKQLLHKQMFSSDEDELSMQCTMGAMHLNEFTDDQKGSTEINSDGSKMIIYNRIQTELKNRNCTIRKRDLYENLLKDATIGLKEGDEATKKAVQNLEYVKSLSKCNDQLTQFVDKVKDLRDLPDIGHNSEGTCTDQGKNFSSSENQVVTGETLDIGFKDPVDVFDNYTRSTDNYILSHESTCEKQTTDTSKNKKVINCQINGIVDKQGIREVQYPDGRTEFWYPNGNVKKISADGTITKLIYYNGDVCESRNDGSIKYFYAATRTWHTTMPDGLEILEFPDGQVERRSKDGTVEVSFPDGSVRILQTNGTEKWALPDGTIAETSADGEKLLILPNGQREVHTKDHKRREYPDGTVKLVYLDGSQETRYAGGRIRLKDKDGNLLMDSHQQ